MLHLVGNISVTEHDNNQPHWMKDMSWLHQEWSVK